MSAKVSHARVPNPQAHCYSFKSRLGRILVPAYKTLSSKSPPQSPCAVLFVPNHHPILLFAADFSHNVEMTPSFPEYAPPPRRHNRDHTLRIRTIEFILHSSINVNHCNEKALINNFSFLAFHRNCPLLCEKLMPQDHCLLVVHRANSSNAESSIPVSLSSSSAKRVMVSQQSSPFMKKQSLSSLNHYKPW